MIRYVVLVVRLQCAARSVRRQPICRCAPSAFSRLTVRTMLCVPPGMRGAIENSRNFAILWTIAAQAAIDRVLSVLWFLKERCPPRRYEPRMTRHSHATLRLEPRLRDCCRYWRDVHRRDACRATHRPAVADQKADHLARPLRGFRERHSPG